MKRTHSNYVIELYWGCLHRHKQNIYSFSHSFPFSVFHVRFFFSTSLLFHQEQYFVWWLFVNPANIGCIIRNKMKIKTKIVNFHWNYSKTFFQLVGKKVRLTFHPIVHIICYCCSYCLFWWLLLKRKLQLNGICYCYCCYCCVHELKPDQWIPIQSFLVSLCEYVNS